MGKPVICYKDAVAVVAIAAFVLVGTSLFLLLGKLVYAVVRLFT